VGKGLSPHLGEQEWLSVRELRLPRMKEEEGCGFQAKATACIKVQRCNR
jgi:hypothetical protein